MSIDFQVDGHIATIRINRPERMNAIDPNTIVELVNVFKEFNKDDSIWVGILTGTGAAFCAGRDIKAQIEGNRDPGTSVYTAERNIFGIADTDKPLIAAVNGFAVGLGWYMVAGCDIRIAVDEARFAMKEVPTGVLGPYWLSMAEVLPWPIGAEFALLGDWVDADRLYALGMLNELVAPGDLMTRAREVAEKFLALPPQHVRHTKALMQRMRALPTPNIIEGEKESRSALNPLLDTREAAVAFIEKRSPMFRGR